MVSRTFRVSELLRALNLSGVPVNLSTTQGGSRNSLDVSPVVSGAPLTGFNSTALDVILGVKLYANAVGVANSALLNSVAVGATQALATAPFGSQGVALAQSGVDNSLTVNQRYQGNLVHPQEGLPTFIEKQSFAPTSVAAATAETVEATGAIVLALGDRVWYHLSAGPVTTLTTAADTLTYVALKGATSGTYYDVAFLEANKNGSFHVPQAEKLNIVARNQDTAAHTFSGSWWALAK